jgi:hypothetical protein
MLNSSVELTGLCTCPKEEALCTASTCLCTKQMKQNNPDQHHPANRSVSQLHCTLQGQNSSPCSQPHITPNQTQHLGNTARPITDHGLHNLHLQAPINATPAGQLCMPKRPKSSTPTASTWLAILETQRLCPTKLQRGAESAPLIAHRWWGFHHISDVMMQCSRLLAAPYVPCNTHKPVHTTQASVVRDLAKQTALGRAVVQPRGCKTQCPHSTAVTSSDIPVTAPSGIATAGGHQTGHLLATTQLQALHTLVHTRMRAHIPTHRHAHEAACTPTGHFGSLPTPHKALWVPSCSTIWLIDQQLVSFQRWHQRHTAPTHARHTHKPGHACTSMMQHAGQATPRHLTSARR